MTRHEELNEGATEAPEERLGERIKLVREKKQLTHDGLSNLAKMADGEGRGISRTTIRGYELGTYKPGARELRILCSALEVTPTWLLLGADQEQTPQVAPDRRPPTPEGRQAKRWADLVFPLFAFLELAPDERRQVADLVETMARLRRGEVPFRAFRSFIYDLADTLQDFVKDKATANPEELRAVFAATLIDVRARHGKEEAEAFAATLAPFIDYMSKPEGVAQKSADV